MIKIKPKVIIFDTFFIIFRSFYSAPNLTNQQNIEIGTVIGFFKTIMSIIKENPQAEIFFATESRTKTFRKEIYEEYKANRQETPQQLIHQISIILSTMKQCNFNLLNVNGFEADDVIASYSNYRANLDDLVHIITIDKDLMALTDHEKIKVIDIINKKTIGSEEVFEKFKVKPNQIEDYLALIGDASDNIPGVPGIGPKTAQDLLKKYNNINGIKNNLAHLKPKTAEMIRKNRHLLDISEELTKLRRDVQVSIVNNQINWQLLKETMSEHGAKSLVLLLEKNFLNKKDTTEARNSTQDELF